MKAHIWEEIVGLSGAVRCTNRIICRGCGSRVPKPNFPDNPELSLKPHPHLLEHSGVPYFNDCEMQLVYNIMES